MKNHLLSVLIAVGLCVATSCDDGRLADGPEIVKDYACEAALMSKFVAVDRLTGTLYIDENKRLTGSDYLINRNRERLERISPVNRTRFLSDLEMANAYISQSLSPASCCAVVCMVNDVAYVIDASGDNEMIIRYSGNELGSRTVENISLTYDRQTERSFCGGESFDIVLSPRTSSAVSIMKLAIGHDDSEAGHNILVVGLKSYLSHRFSVELAGIEGSCQWKLRGNLLAGPQAEASFVIEK